MGVQPVPLKNGKKNARNRFWCKRVPSEQIIWVQPAEPNFFEKIWVEPAQLEFFEKLWVQPAELEWDAKNSSWAGSTRFLGRRSSGASSPRALEKWSGGTHSARWQKTSGLNRQNPEVCKTHSSGTILPRLVTRKRTVRETGHKKYFYIQILCWFLKRFYVFPKWSWVFLERTRIFSGIQFTTHFIDFFVVETKRFVGSYVNVILMRQTCGQRSSRAVESKRRALGNHFSERICCMFPISKCRGEAI